MLQILYININFLYMLYSWIPPSPPSKGGSQGRFILPIKLLFYLDLAPSSKKPKNLIWRGWNPIKFVVIWLKIRFSTSGARYEF